MKKIDKEECPYCEERILLEYDPQKLDWSTMIDNSITIEKICPLCKSNMSVEILAWEDIETNERGYNITNVYKRNKLK